MSVKGKKKKPGFSSALLLSIPVNGSCFSMWFEEPRRVVFLKTQLLMVLHHPPPYSKVYITLSMAKKIKSCKFMIMIKMVEHYYHHFTYL
jgi:hypothetical protein